MLGLKLIHLSKMAPLSYKAQYNEFLAVDQKK